MFQVKLNITNVNKYSEKLYCFTFLSEAQIKQNTAPVSINELESL